MRDERRVGWLCWRWWLIWKPINSCFGQYCESSSLSQWRSQKCFGRALSFASFDVCLTVKIIINLSFIFASICTYPTNIKKTKKCTFLKPLHWVRWIIMRRTRMNVKPVALPVFISLTGKPCLLPLELKINIEWMIFTKYNQHEQNDNWNINSRIIQWRWQRFTCIQKSIGQGCLESDVAHRQRSPHRVVEGVPGVVRVQLVLGGFEERQHVLPTPTSILFEIRTIFLRCQPFITKSRY